MQVPPPDETGLEARGSTSMRSAGQLTGASTAEGPGAGAGAWSSSLALTAEAPAGQQIHHASAKLNNCWASGRADPVRAEGLEPSGEAIGKTGQPIAAGGNSSRRGRFVAPPPPCLARCAGSGVLKPLWASDRPAPRQVLKGSMLTCQQGEEGCGLHSASDVFGRKPGAGGLWEVGRSRLDSSV